MRVRAESQTPYGVTANMSPPIEGRFFFLDYSRAKGDNMAKLAFMGDILINQGVFYAGR
jgi:hypothetical protein